MSNAATETNPIFDFQLDEFYLDLQEDGRNISILSQAEIAQMPFPGLRPFKTSEFQLFKGRGGQAEELVKRLKRNRFLSVIGSSGTGKSSLVRAGLIPQLFGGSLYEAGSKWNIAICRPGKNPITNLAIALSSVKGESKNKELLHENFDTIEPLLNSSIYGLLEVNEMLEQGKDKTEHSNLLIIVDQFEELFRYDRKDLGRENIENHFVDLLLKAASNPSNPVYVIITMRSEFLGDCVKYRGLPEAINEGQYLVPGLNRTQVKEVIEGPIHAAGKAISPGLTELLINEIEEAKVKENLDQLPILQHALMRTYQEAMREGATEITYEHYSRIGGMQKALAIHAKEKFDELSDGKQSGDALSKKQQIAKIIFQALTDASTDLKGGRRPTELKNIYGIAASISAAKEEVDNVVDKFRDSDTSFIMPPVNTALHDDLIMDISHESLMRNWDLLKKWIEEEVRYGRFYQRLHERREEDGQFIQGTLLAELVNWRDCYPHNAVWASRYHNLPKGQNNAALNEELYAKNLFFLQRSEGAAVEARDAEKKRFAEEARQQREEDLRQQKERSRKRITWVLSAGLLLSIGLLFWAFTASKEATANFKNAEAQRKRAEGFNTELIQKTIVAEAATDSAKKDRDRLKQLYQTLDNQAKELQTSNIALGIKTAEAVRLGKIALENSKLLALQSKEMKKHLAEGELHKQDFYTSKSTSAQEKEAIIPYLFMEPLKEVDIDYENFIKPKLLEDVNAAVNAREALLRNPVLGLRNTRSIWRRNKTEPLMQLVIPEIFKSNIFHSAKVDLSQVEFLSAPPTVYAASADGKRFGLANEDQIVLGSFVNGTPEPQDLIETASAFADGADSNARPASAPVINALSLGAGNTLALLNDSLLVRWQAYKKPATVKLPGQGELLNAEFSPNAEHLVTVDRDTLVKLWSLNPLLPPKPDTVRNLGSFKNFKQADFSSSSQKLLLVYDNGYGVFDLRQKPGKQSERLHMAGAVAAFSGDGGCVVSATSGTSNSVTVYDTAGKYISTIKLFASTNDDNFSTARITDIGLSADYKKLFVNQGGSLVLYQRTDGNILINPSESYRSGTNANFSNLRSKKLFSFRDEIAKAKFLDTANLIALTADGKAYTWRLKPPSASPDEDFENIRSLTDSTFEERKDAGGVNMKQLMKSGQKELLQQAAGYYYNEVGNYDDRKNEDYKKVIDTAKHLYSALAELDTGFVRIGALTRLASLSDKLYSTEKSKPSPDTLALIDGLRQSTNDREKLLAVRPQSIGVKTQLSSDYWDLSWLMLFRKHYAVAINCALRSAKLDKASNGAYTNVALGLLLKGDYTKAEKIYSQFKDSVFADGSGRNFKEAFDEDLKELENAGIIVKTDDVLQKEIAHIRRDILKLK